MTSTRARLVQFGLVLAFWGYSFWNLDQSPMVSEDEPWILSPGYSLFTRGIYGSELFTGYYGMERHYLEFMPLMSVVLGATTRLLGVGPWQMRFAPVVLGTLLLALTGALAARFGNATTGALASVLLIFWQWTREGSGQLSSGVPLLDLARIARYDILVAVLGVSALLMVVRMQQTRRGLYALVGGLCVGLAGLTHVYGAFWWAALGLVVLIAPGYHNRWVHLGWLVGLPLVLWAIWASVLLAYWSDFTGQLRLNVSCFAGRPCFDVGQVLFYWHNLLTESYRYQLNTLAPLTRLGGWLLVLGVPTALIWLAWRAIARREVKAIWLLLPALVIPLLLAVLMPRKLFNYLISLAPLWGVLLAWAGSHWLTSARWAGRLVLVLGLVSVMAQGALALALAQRTLDHQIPLTRLLADVRKILPPSGRILGPHAFWLGLAERDYRSCGLPSFLSNPEVGPPAMSFADALERIAPRIVLLDGPNAAVWADTSTPYAQERHQAWLTYLLQHHARIAREWYEPSGRLRLRVYILDDPD